MLVLGRKHNETFYIIPKSSLGPRDIIDVKFLGMRRGKKKEADIGIEASQEYIIIIEDLIPDKNVKNYVNKLIEKRHSYYDGGGI